MILGYTVDEARKAVVQIVSALLLLAGFFIVFDPSFGPAVLAVVTALFGVIQVFYSTNVNELDVTKALQSLTASVIGVVTVFTTVDPSRTEQWLSLIALAVPPIWVYVTRNRPPSPTRVSGERGAIGIEGALVILIIVVAVVILLSAVR